MRKVIGSSPISSTRKTKPHPHGWGFVFGMVLDIGLEEGDGRRPEKVSGGHFFRPGKSPIAMQTQPNGCGCIAISIIVEGSSPNAGHLYHSIFT